MLVAGAAPMNVDDVLVPASTSASSLSAVSPRAGSPTPEAPANELQFMYYINDGVYGAFNCIIFDHQVPRGIPLDAPAPGMPLHESSIWGPTCDSMDKVESSVLLPELAVGDWLFYPNMGAYTSAAASNFNGFVPANKVYTFTHNGPEDLADIPLAVPFHPLSAAGALATGATGMVVDNAPVAMDTAPVEAAVRG